MNYLILIDRIELHPGATALCAMELAFSLANEENKIFVLTLGANNSESIEAGVHIQTIKNASYKVRFKKPPNLLYKKAWLLLKKCFYYGLSALRLYDFDLTYNNSTVIKTALQLIDENDIDIVVSFSEPFGTQIVWSRLKQVRSIKWIAYEMDPFALNYNRPKSKEKINRTLEERVLDSADMIVMVNGINEENVRRNHLLHLQNKIVSIPLPGYRFDEALLKRVSIDSGYDVDSTLTLVYTGIFYPKFRNPIALCELLSRVNFDYELHLYGSINEADFKNYPEVLRNCVFYGYKSKQECEKACLDADILIDIQNDIPNQIPSKLLTYMSYGKKILSLYSEVNLIGVAYLENYSNALSVRKDQVKMSSVVEDVNVFCMSPALDVDIEIIRDCLRPYEHETVVDQFKKSVELLMK